MKKSDAQSRTLFFFSGRPCAGASDADVVQAAWNYVAIDQAYKTYRAHLQTVPRNGETLRERLLDWGNTERDLWARCMVLDPLLPKGLWPKKYAGEKAWFERLAALKAAGAVAREVS